MRALLAAALAAGPAVWYTEGMAEHEREEQNRRARAAARARHEARMAEARRFQEERRRAFEARMVDLRRRVSETGGEHSSDAARRAGWVRITIDAPGDRRRGPRPDPRRGREEGGEAVPAVPKPRPNPLSGAAAAPLDFDN